MIYSRRQTKTGPLTPAKTPTSHAFEPASPDPVSFESSFHDPRVTWDTANPGPSSPQEFATPRSQADGGGREQESNLKADIEAELSSHVHHLSPNPYLTLPPVETSRQLASSPGPGFAKRTCLDATQIGKSKKELQSAPPLSSASRRKNRVKQPKSIEPTTPTAMVDPKKRRMSTSNNSHMGPPETPGHHVAASPQLFPSLQFSPDLFHTPMSGPATAPAFPQNRLFWDPSSNADDLTYQDPFGPAHSDLVSQFNPSPVPSHGFQSASSVSSAHAYDLPSSQATEVGAPPLSPSIDSSGFPIPFTASPRVPAPAPEDPSMFLSSPARRFGPAPQPLSSFSSSKRTELQAYHHQIQESKREEALERAKKPKTKRSSIARDGQNVLKRPVSPPSSRRPAPKRSSTHSGIGDNFPHQRRQSQVSFADSVSVMSEKVRIPHGGRSSPLKRSSADAYQDVDPTRSKIRTSLSFTIDEDGRAKTIVTRIPDRAASRTDMDDESSGSETDSLDARDFDIITSQNNSFAFPEQEEQNRAIDRLRYESRTHSKSSSYSSTMGSSASAHPSSRTSSALGGARSRSRLPGDPYTKNVLDAQAHRSFTSYHSQPPNDDNPMLDDDNNEPGDAQQALRTLLKHRARRSSTNIAHFPPPSQLKPLQEFHSSPPVPPHHNNNHYNIFNASPTTITDPGIATPSTDRDSRTSSNSSTRCVCNSSSPDGQLMIQWYLPLISTIFPPSSTTNIFSFLVNPAPTGFTPPVSESPPIPKSHPSISASTACRLRSDMAGSVVLASQQAGPGVVVLVVGRRRWHRRVRLRIRRGEGGDEDGGVPGSLVGVRKKLMMMFEGLMESIFFSSFLLLYICSHCSWGCSTAH